MILIIYFSFYFPLIYYFIFNFSGLAYVAEKLREHDIAVFIVPEVATMIAAGGGMIKSIDFTNDDAVNFQVV